MSSRIIVLGTMNRNRFTDKIFRCHFHSYRFEQMSDFVHLHTHTIFSPLDGVASPTEYFNICKERGYPAIAITEHGNMASVPDCYWASQKTGVKYIAGSEIYYNDYEEERKRLEKSGKTTNQMDEDEKQKYARHRHLTVLCKNMTGYKNLLQIKTEASEHNFFRKPRASLDIIRKHADGLIILSGCMNGPISFEIMQHIHKKNLGVHSEEFLNHYIQNAVSLAKHYKDIMGDDFYIELQMPGIDGDVMLFKWLLSIAKSLDIKCVLTNDAHYIESKDYNLQRIMMAVDQGVTVDSDELFISDSTNGFFKTRDELRNTFTESFESKDSTMEDFEAACDHALEIAEKCESFKPDTSSKLPQIEDADNVLRSLVAKALRDTGLGNKKEYIDRAKFELNRIIEKEFSSYFLICRDLVLQSTKKMGMPVGPRGSAGGSLVCYLIGIHEINPIEFNLSFDRFLSSSRGGKMLQANMEDDELIEEL